MATINICRVMAGLSPHTQRSYQRWLRMYLRVASLDKVSVKVIVPKLNVPDLKLLLNHLKTRDLSKQSIMQAKAAVAWLARQMAEAGHISYDVPAALSALPVPRAESGQNPGVWLTQAEVRQLLDALRKQESSRKALLARDTAIIVLMATCGLRRDEVRVARWSDMGQQSGQTILRVHGKGEKLRTVKLPDMTVQAMDDWRQYHPMPDGTYPIFSRILSTGAPTIDSITDRFIWSIVRRAALRAGLPPISPHDLRRTFARGAYEAGAPIELIRQALGHANLATTERYINATLELRRAATDIWADALVAVQSGASNDHSL